MPWTPCREHHATQAATATHQFWMNKNRVPKASLQAFLSGSCRRNEAKSMPAPRPQQNFARLPGLIFDKTGSMMFNANLPFSEYWTCWKMLQSKELNCILMSRFKPWDLILKPTHPIVHRKRENPLSTTKYVEVLSVTILSLVVLGQFHCEANVLQLESKRNAFLVSFGSTSWWPNPIRLLPKRIPTNLFSLKVP